MTQEQFALLLSEIEKKNSWGKNELKHLLLDILSGRIAIRPPTAEPEHPPEPQK